MKVVTPGHSSTGRPINDTIVLVWWI